MALGYKERLDQHMEIVAWQTALLRNPHVPKKYQRTWEQLLGRKLPMSNEQVLEKVDKLILLSEERRRKNGE